MYFLNYKASDYNQFHPQINRWRITFFILAAAFLLIAFVCYAKIDFTPEQIAFLKSKGYPDASIQALSDKFSTWKEVEDYVNYYDNPIDPHADPNYTLGSALSGAGYIVGKGIWGVVCGVVSTVLALVAYFLTYLVALAGGFLDLILKPELYNFTNKRLIVEGWKMTRDVCNLFFLLVLLFIAFCTILQIPKYHARKTLLMFILMALLINFSKPIAVFIFDGSQLLMNLFLNKIGAGVGSNGSLSTQLSSVSDIAKNVYEKLPRTSLFENELTVVTYLFGVVFLFMFAVALLVMGIFLLIRIVAVMLLIIVSPLAFLASAIPDFNKISSSWWDALFKYSYYGPAAAFFLYLSTKLAAVLPKVTFDANGNKELSEMIENFLHYAIVIVFLYASIIMAQKFGIQFAEAVTKRGDKILKGGISRLTGARYVGNFFRSHYQDATQAGKAKLKQRLPTLHRFLTGEGRAKARQKFWSEKVFKTTTPLQRQQREVAEARDKGRKEGFTKADWLHLLNPINKTATSSEKMAAALELAKEGNIENGAQYRNGLDALASAPQALRDTYEKDAKKKNIHAVIEEEIASNPQGLTRRQIYDKHLDSIKPAELGDQKMDAFANIDPKTGAFISYKAEFADWANKNLAGLHTGVKNDLAKKLDAKHLALFQDPTRGWV